MMEYKELWQKCLNMIRERYGEYEKEHEEYKGAYETWFSKVQFIDYTAEEHKLQLRLPSRYVYYFLETFGLKILQWAIISTFGKSTKLSYHIQPEFSFAEIADNMRRRGYNNRDFNHIKINNARQRMEEGLKYYVKNKPIEWFPGYDKIANWLMDNRGKGLLVVGTPGVGKSLICQKILPTILFGEFGREIKSVNATELHDRLAELKQESIVIIDDLGKEPTKHYGDKDQSFYELCNHAEQTGALLIITTNLATAPNQGESLPLGYSDSIQHRYGIEVYSRLKAITRLARVEGKDMR